MAGYKVKHYLTQAHCRHMPISYSLVYCVCNCSFIYVLSDVRINTINEWAPDLCRCRLVLVCSSRDVVVSSSLSSSLSSCDLWRRLLCTGLSDLDCLCLSLRLSVCMCASLSCSLSLSSDNLVSCLLPSFFPALSNLPFRCFSKLLSSPADFSCSFFFDFFSKAEISEIFPRFLRLLSSFWDLSVAAALTFFSLCRSCFLRCGDGVEEELELEPSSSSSSSGNMLKCNINIHVIHQQPCHALKSRPGRNLQFFDRQLQILDMCL